MLLWMMTKKQSKKKFGDKRKLNSVKDSKSRSKLKKRGSLNSPNQREVDQLSRRHWLKEMQSGHTGLKSWEMTSFLIKLYRSKKNKIKSYLKKTATLIVNSVRQFWPNLKTKIRRSDISKIKPLRWKMIETK